MFSRYARRIVSTLAVSNGYSERRRDATGACNCPSRCARIIASVWIMITTVRRRTFTRSGRYLTVPDCSTAQHSTYGRAAQCLATWACSLPSITTSRSHVDVAHRMHGVLFVRAVPCVQTSLPRGATTSYLLRGRRVWRGEVGCRCQNGKRQAAGEEGTAGTLR